MELDMYLTRRVYVQRWDHTPPEKQYSVTVSRGGVPVESTMPITHLIYEAGYWRKANHIHQWFVKNVQNDVDDCGDYYVLPENLQELLSACQEVLSLAIVGDDGMIANAEAVAAILPTQGGFFFGSTEYGQRYLDDVALTIAIIEKCVADKEGNYYYHSSW